MKNLHSQTGQSLIEFLIVLGLTAIFLPALITGLVASRGGKAQDAQRLQAVALLKEGVEATRSVRERGWDNVGNLNSGLDYHPSVSGSIWNLVVNSEVINGFTRKINLQDVYRDTTGKITTNTSPPNTIDPSTKKLVVTVSWGSPTYSISSTLYITRYLGNVTFVDTLKSDFDSGLSNPATNNVFVTNTSGGEVRLTYLGGGTSVGPDWCNPSSNLSGIDLSGSGAANAITAIVGQAFIGTGQNNSGPAMVQVTGLASNPPVPVQSGSFNNSYKTNDIFGETGFAYIATDTNAKEVVIINTTNFTEVGNFDAPGNADGVSVFVSDVGSNHVGFVITGTNLYTFNLSSALVSKPQLGTVALGGTGTSVYVVGNYAYVTIKATSNQLRIYELSNNGATLTLRGSFTPPSPGAQGGRDVYVSTDGNRAYLTTAASTTQREFFIINTSNKLVPALVSPTSVYDTNGMDPKAADMVLSGNRAVIVGVGGEQYQVVNIRDESSPVRCGGFTDTNGIYDIATVTLADGRAYAYIASGQTNQEFKIIQGGNGGQLSASGMFESRVLPVPNLSQNAGFNRFNVSFSKPGDSAMVFRMAIKDQSAPGSCSGVIFMDTDFKGPFSDDSAIPLENDGLGFENPGGCLKYRVNFTPTSDFLSSPIFNDITVNYTP